MRARRQQNQRSAEAAPVGDPQRQGDRRDLGADDVFPMGQQPRLGEAALLGRGASAVPFTSVDARSNPAASLVGSWRLLRRRGHVCLLLNGRGCLSPVPAIYAVTDC
jgi:hypothetical protein